MGFGRLVWNCSGILNWTVLLLILVAIKMFLENLNKVRILKKDHFTVVVSNILAYCFTWHNNFLMFFKENVMDLFNFEF